MIHRRFTCCLVVALASSTFAANKSKKIDFARQVLPILSEKCFVCHGPDGEAKEELRLDSYREATKVRDGRQAIDPKSPTKSTVLVRIHSQDNPMPPADAEKQLTAAEKKVLSLWVKQGGTYAKHWAFVPPSKTTPKGTNRGHEIDAFIRRKLKQQGLTFAPEAKKSVLARRTSLVLTGLPPNVKLLQQFLRDKSSRAYERYVDRLLASPHYGEHQARYWLDAVRYGDTHGLHLDNRRGIYPYRDWVVMALNRNQRLDEFIAWQLAGDLLPKPTLEQKVATGFVRMNPTTAEGGAIPAEFQAKNNFDRVETLGTVFLGMSLTCARCHSHKYDPIPQIEYYRLMAFFNSTAESSMDGNKYAFGPTVRAPANMQAWESLRQWRAKSDALLARVKKGLGKLKGLKPAARKSWLASDRRDQILQLASSKGPFTGTPHHKRAVKLASDLTKLEKKFTTTLVAQDLRKPRATRVLTRGEYNLPTGKALQPGILKVMSSFPAKAPRNRLGLAKWLTARGHPLTARVLVNRIWQRTFGYGLVRTPEDFGLQGQHPTHPQLLDWLAVELQDSQWNLKHMLKLMVTSRTFKQSSRRRTEIKDPANTLFARGPSHRLDAEVIRDIGLWASGLLISQAGGEGGKPYQPAGMWLALMHPASNTKRYVADKDRRLYHRSLYVYWKRTSPHPMMTLFDAPSRESSCVRRSRTNTPLQSLGLLNETQRSEMGRVLAERLLHLKANDNQRLDQLFLMLASRKPSPRERQAIIGLLNSMRRRYQNARKDAEALLSLGNAPRDKKIDPREHAAWTQITVTVLASDLAIMLY